MIERRVLLVTGGSRGIGAEIARRAAAKGWAIAVNFAVNEHAATGLVREIEGSGGAAIALKGNVEHESEIMSVFEAIDRHFGRLDGLVNNAGIVDRKARLDEMSASRISRMMAVNVVGPLLCAREAVRRMSTRHGGRGGAIVNISSVAAVLGSAGEYVDYAASKGAMDTFTVGLAREVATEGIRVNCVRPGTIDTDIHASGGQPDRAARVAPSIPMQRPGRADEIANAVMWVLSDEATYATGAILDVSGGR